MAELTLEDAIRRSIKSYFKNGQFEELNKASDKRIKYSKKYFDGIEQENFNTTTDWKTIKEGV